VRNVGRGHGWALGVAVSAAAALALPAVALPCTPSTKGPTGKVVQRPTARTGVYAYGRGVPVRSARAKEVVVHWATRGADAPPSNDVDSDGIPDYVELTAAAAERAFTKYTARGPAGFRLRRPLCDRGGPDRRPDVYIKRLRGELGAAVPRTRAAGGPFVVVSRDLDIGDALSTRSLRLVVAHELFHLVQFAYVPSGMPRWIAEGTANALALYAIQASPGLTVDTSFAVQTDRWLQEPWRSVFDGSVNCARCYGGGLWWLYAVAYKRLDAINLFFNRLARSKRIGLGRQQLDATFRQTADFNFDQVFGHIAARIYRAGVPVRTRFAVNAATPGASAEQQLLGMSTHYIPIEVPETAQSLELTVQARGGAFFLNRLIIGGPSGPDVQWQPQVDRNRLVFTPQFTDPSQRRLMLIVTNGSQRAARYVVSWRVP
jgi:hypothetical protein